MAGGARSRSRFDSTYSSGGGAGWRLGCRQTCCIMTSSVDALLLRHFGLRENPFGVTPDPRFLVMTRTHREALASLVNGIECGFGFQVLVAQPGMGKTTLLFDFLERFQTSRTAFLFQQQDDSGEFLQSLLTELKSESAETSKAKLYGQLNHLLSEAAQTQERVIVVVDEAQNLQDPVLETLRQLSNFETARAKLLQIVLAGQPQLAKKLARPEQEQLRQRVSTIARLSPLSLDETRTYLNHRLTIAGYRGPGVFTPPAVQSVWSSARGIPRNMNTLCFNAMLLAYAQSAKRVDEQAVEEAAHDLDLNFVLADMAGSHRPSINLRDQSLSAMDIDWQKQDEQRQDQQRQNRNTPTIPQASTTSTRQTSLAVPAAISAASGTSLSLTPPSLTSSIPTSTAVTIPSSNLPDPGLPSSTLPSSSLKETQSSSPPPVVVPVSSTQHPRAATAARTPGLRSSTVKKVLWASLVAAALGAGMLFGHGIGNRGQSQYEVPESHAEPPRVQESQPVLDAPLARSRKNKETEDDGPEVIVRTFPQSAPNQPEAVAQQNVKAIFFDGDSAQVSSRYDITLQRIAEILAADPDSTAIVEGHTDNSGEEHYNLELSTRRAMAVKDVLETEYNIPATRLSTVGEGSSSPIESNDTTSGRAYNRRVEVRIMHQGG
jgi:type II secretory pathway predicted ATPase ExeA/outer membrane protein OmpA-like peptidoglycan-associated protein